MQQIRHLNKAQCALESALGSVESAARIYAESGDEARALRLFQLMLAVKETREPEVVDFLERRRLARCSAGAAQ